MQHRVGNRRSAQPSSQRSRWLGDGCRRDDPAGTFSGITPVIELNTADEDWPGAISRDGCRLYYTSKRNIYVAERPR
jgi:hypothetical protein